MKNSNINFIDSFVNIFRKFEILKPFISIYDKYKEAVLYLFFGALTTLVNILSYTLLTKIFNIEYMLSNVTAWILSVLFAYITNRKVVFKSKNKKVIKEAEKFLGARIVTLLIDMLFMYVTVTVLLLNDKIMKIISNIIIIILNYVFSKLFVFVQKESEK